MDSSKPAEDGSLRLPYIHPMLHLDTFIPAKVQRGLATVDLNFSCIDVTSNYIAIGTTAEIAYLFDRRNGEIQKLRCQGPKSNAVTCIRCLETVELMVAVGMSAGIVAIFQIPLRGSPQNNNSNEIEKYSLSGLHNNPMTYLEWSRNGMKLFSGDENGVVAQTDIDFSMHLCKSTVLLRESHAIVQIVYEQRSLLVSTRHRTVLWTNDNQVKQLGQKERKSLGNFGACFCTLQEKPHEMLVLASRPALRLWKANVDGKVLETFIFKDKLLQANQILNVDSRLNFMPASSVKPAESQFGILHNFMDKYILTFNSSVLYLLTISEPTIVKRCEGLDTVVSVASNADEILVLNGLRNIVRISSSSDRTVFQQNLIREESFLPSLKFMPNALKDLENKLKGKSIPMTTSIFGMIKPIIAHSANMGNPMETEQQNGEVDLGMNASPLRVQPIEWLHKSGAVDEGENNDSAMIGDETTEAECSLPAVVEVPNNSHLWAPLSESEDDPNDSGVGIVFEQHVRKGHNVKKRNATPSLVHPKFENADSSLADSAEPVLKESLIDALEAPEAGGCDEAAISRLDLTSQAATTSNSREEKEILLAQMLDLKELLPEVLQNPNQDENDTFVNPSFQASSSNTDFKHEDLAIFSHQQADTDDDNVDADADADPSSLPSNGSSLEFDIYRTNFSRCSNEDEDEDVPSQLNSECNSYLSYGPPSGSSNMNSMGSLGGRSLDLPVRPHSLSLHPHSAASKPLPRTNDSCQASSQSLPPTLNSKADEKSKTEVKYNDFWVQHKPPGHIHSLGVCEHYIVCTDTKDSVYYSSFKGLGLEWHRTEYLANQICISSSGKRVWRIYRNSAYALVQPSDQGPFGRNWVEVDLNIKNVSITETCVWYVTRDGCVFAQTNIDDDQAFNQSRLVPFTSKIAQVTCAESSAWAVTVDNTLLCRLGITETNPIGSEWARISFESGTGNILAAALGTLGTVWIVDDALNVWFKSGLTPKFAPQGTDKKWWQVQISDYIYQNVSTLQNITSTLIDSFNPEQLTSMLCRGSSCVVSTKPRGTWFYHALNHQLFTNQNDVIGHYWSRFNINASKSAPSKWKVMTASGVYRHHGGIFLWQPGSSIFCFNPTSMRGSHIKLPESCTKDSSDLQCLSASPESLWLLTKSGGIFIRKDITAGNAGGNNWEKLELTQIANHKLVHISCGSNLVWACDSNGAILMRIGSLQAPSVHSLQPAWVIVDDVATGTSQQHQSTFVKIFVGPLDYTVWAIDNKSNVYVREGIFPELLIGLGWVPVSGIQATHLAISEHAVYALTPTKRIYRRYNISRNNYIGDYWMELPGLAEQLSVTVDDKLWALNTRQQLIQHQEYILSGTGKKAKEKRVESPTGEQPYSSCNEEDWELVEP